MTKHAELPWTVPVPIKRLKFEALHPAHTAYGVVVDLAAIDTFACGQSIDSERLAHCDLQTNVDANFERRLGSGRAVAFDGHYIKGVGRTQLAGNWNGEDVYHASGMLFPSGAAREFVVSRLLEAHGAADAIVPCVGVLTKTLPIKFRGILDSTFRQAPDWKKVRTARSTSADDRLQAITVKPSDFARASNFTWWLCNFPQIDPREPRIATFVKLLMEFACPPSMRMNEGHDASPKHAADALAHAMTRAIDHFYDAWSAGVSWGSLHNNFALDGRFLDLETPKIHRAPLWGVQLKDEFGASSLPDSFVFDDPQAQFVGDEVGIIAQQLLRFRAFLSERIRFFRRTRLLHPTETQFLVEFDHELSLAIGPPHPLSSLESLTVFAEERMAQTLQLSRRERVLVRDRFIWANGGRFLGRRGRAPRRPEALRVRRVEGPSARPEVLLSFDTYVPDFLYEQVREGVEANIIANEMLIRADETTRVDKWLDALRQPIAPLRSVHKQSSGSRT